MSEKLIPIFLQTSFFNNPFLVFTFADCISN